MKTLKILVLLSIIFFLAAGCTSVAYYPPKTLIDIEDYKKNERAFTQLTNLDEFRNEDGEIWLIATTTWLIATTTPGSLGCDYNYYGDLIEDYKNDCQPKYKTTKDEQKKVIQKLEEYNQRAKEYNTFHGNF